MVRSSFLASRWSCSSSSWVSRVLSCCVERFCRFWVGSLGCLLPFLGLFIIRQQAMRQNCKQRIISLMTAIRGLQPNRKCTQAMLILDDTTTPMLSAVIHDFFALNMKNITKAEFKKKPEPNCVGIYFIGAASVPSVADDFKKTAPYHTINILLPSQITPEVMKSIGGEKRIVERLAYLGELRLGTKYVDNRCALLTGQERLFRSLVHNEAVSSVELGKKIVEGVISGFGDHFALKIHFRNTPLLNNIISAISEEYRKHQQALAESKEEGADSKFVTVSMVLMDRKMDMVSPLVRNFNYFSMISDLYKVDYEEREVKLREGKTVTINFEDEVFSQYKTMMINKAQSSIEPEFKEFQQRAKNRKSKLEGEGSVTNKEIKEIIRQIPNYNRLVTSYEEQISIMHEIGQIAKETSLPEVGELEQLAATGLNGYGQEVKDKKICNRVLEYSAKTPHIHYALKLLVLLMLCNEVPESDKKLILGRINEHEQYQPLAKLLSKKMDMLVSRPAKLKPMFKKEKVYLDLHEALCTTLVCELIERGKSKLLQTVAIGQQPKKLSPSKFDTSAKNTARQEWLVCMLGGISVSQICQLERLPSIYPSCHMNIMSTSLYNSWSYLSQLSKLAQE